MVAGRRRALPAALLEAQRAAKQRRLEDRARLIGAGIIQPKSARRNKFNNVKVVRNGIQHDSLDEAEYSAKLDLMQASGQILRWERAKTFVLLDAKRAIDRVKYTPDFEVWPMPKFDGHVSKGQTSGTSEFPLPQPYYVDVKGSRVNRKTGKRRTPTATQAFSIRVRLWRAVVPFELRVFYSDGVEKIAVPARVIG